MVIALIVPILITAIAFGLVISWIPELPDPIATHWGADGPNGYGSVWVPLTVLLLLGVGLPILMWVLIITTHGRGFTVFHKLLACAAMFTAVVGVVITIGTIAPQRGLDDASQAGRVGWVVALAIGIALLAAAVSWFILPPADHIPPPSITAPTMRIEPDEQAVWVARTNVARPAQVGILVGLAVLTGVYAYLIVVTDGRVWPILFVLFLVVALAVVLDTRWRIRIDRSGLVARSSVGWPRFSVPLDEIGEVTAIDVSALADFGGWGLRIGRDGSWGVVTRSGPAIRITRSGKRGLVVTVDDAATGAGLLAAYVAERQRA